MKGRVGGRGRGASDDVDIDRTAWRTCVVRDSSESSPSLCIMWGVYGGYVHRHS
jgi:hypothetical protein